MSDKVRDYPRVTLRPHPDIKSRIDYWAASHGISSNEYIINAVVKAIEHENKDYDLPTAEIARLNQLVDSTALLSQNVRNLEVAFTSSIQSLMNLSRGEDYLYDQEESGDLS